MRDPMDELASFDPGDDMNPLPPSEIRRRGDRLRRRNTLLVAAGAAAAVVLIATPLAMLGAQRADDAPDPAPPSPTATEAEADGEWPTRIPEGFPLTSGMPEDDGSDEYRLAPPSRSSRSMLEAQDLQACGRLVVGFDTFDRLTTRLAHGSSGQTREIQLFADDAEAAGYVDAIRRVYAACPESDSGGGSPPFFSHRVSHASLGDDSLVVTSASDSIGQGVIVAVRVGNAVFVDSAGNEGPGDQVDSLAVSVRENLADVIGAMNELQRRPVERTEGWTTVIADDFPIDRELTSPEGDPISGPGHDADGVSSLATCHGDAETFGPSGWPREYVDRLAVRATGPEYEHGRELITLEDDDAAMAMLESIRDLIERCPGDGMVGRVHTGGPSGDLGMPTGAEEFLVTSRTMQDGALGGVIHHYVRVGNAVLGISEAGEWSSDTVTPGIEALFEVSDPLAQEMCVFSAGGCVGGGAPTGDPAR